MSKCPAKQKAEKEIKKKKSDQAKEKINKIVAKQDKIRKSKIIKEIKGENTNLELKKNCR